MHSRYPYHSLSDSVKHRLDPCPFCGRKNPSTDSLSNGAFVITCDCLAIVAVQAKGNVNLAVNAWNSRTCRCARQASQGGK